MVSFGGDSAAHTQDLQVKIDTHSKSLVSVVERQKDLENKVDIIDEKIELLDHNSIREIKRLSQDLKHLRDEIHDIKTDIEQVKEFQTRVRKQFKVTTTKDEVQKLERYIDLWNPMNFATKEELLDIRDNIISHLTEDIETFLQNEKKQKESKKLKEKSKED